jgi:hypothetical protein
VEIWLLQQLLLTGIAFSSVSARVCQSREAFAAIVLLFRFSYLSRFCFQVSRLRAKPTIFNPRQ